MECLFNRYIPDSTKNLIIIKPIGKTFINGLASSYDESFPIELNGKIDELTYKNAIGEINENLINYWPCLCARCMGYLCCLCTFGLSFCIPSCCIKDAENMLERQIIYLNRQAFLPSNLKLGFKKKCSTSWLEIQIYTNNDSIGKSITREEESGTSFQANPINIFQFNASANNK